MIVHEGVVSNETQSMLLELLRGIYGFNVTIAEINILNQHFDYVALLVRIDHPAVTLAVKLAGRDAPYAYPFDRTAYWHKLVTERTSIPMPEIIAVDVSYRVYPWQYLVKSYLPGNEWATVKPLLHDKKLRQAYQQIGDAVAQLHSISFDSFGDVSPNGIEVADSDYFGTLLERVNASIRQEHIKQDFLDLLQANEGLFSKVTQPRLCHEDLHPHNILFYQSAGEWQLATVLDFDKAWAGHYEIDLAKLELWTGMTGDGFWDGYTDVMRVDDLYPQRRPFYQLWWCLDYAANTPKHLADTAQLCNLLHFPMIERFD